MKFISSNSWQYEYDRVGMEKRGRQKSWQVHRSAHSSQNCCQCHLATVPDVWDRFQCGFVCFGEMKLLIGDIHVCTIAYIHIYSYSLLQYYYPLYMESFRDFISIFYLFLLFSSSILSHFHLTVFVGLKWRPVY